MVKAPLLVLETYDPGLVLRAGAQPILVVGAGARQLLLGAHVSIVTSRPDTPVAVLGLASLTPLPRDFLSDGLATSVLGRDWYLVDETACREAYGDDRPTLGLPQEDVTLWPSERAIAIQGHEGGAVAAMYYEEPDA